MIGVRRGLAEMLPGAVFAAIGIVDVLTQDAAVGWWAEVSIQPSGAVVLARIQWAGTSATGGDFWPVVVGDEVLVVYPDGDPNRAIAIAGLGSSMAPIPSSFTNSAPGLVHPSGKSFRVAAANPVGALVTQSLLPDLQAAVTEIAALFGALAALGITLPSSSTISLATNLATLYRSRGVTSD